MRKVFTVLICVALCVLTFISCSNTTNDDKATISFTIPNARDTAITGNTTGGATIDSNTKLYWYYSAQPTDENALFQFGRTDKKEITVYTDTYKSDEITLSQGKWNFTLWALTPSEDQDNPGTNSEIVNIDGVDTKCIRVYYGEVSNVLIQGKTPTSIPIEISNIIEGATAYIEFSEVYVIPEGTSTHVAPNRVTINGTEITIYDSDTDAEAAKDTDPGLYYNYTDGVKTSVSGILEKTDGKYNIVVQYVTTYKDEEGNVENEVVNAEYEKEITIATLQTFTLSGFFGEDTSTAIFNGIMTDGSMGNVYDLTSRTYYWLVEDGDTYVFKTAKDASDTVDITDLDELELLDCSLSNSIPDKFIYDPNANVKDEYYKNGYTWTVYHPVECNHTDLYYKTINAKINASADGTLGSETEGFVGGYGTKIEPYLIDSMDYLSSTYLNRSYAYYKWAKQNDTIDYRNKLYMGPVLCGAFDGNGLTLIGLKCSLFVSITAGISTTIVLKNFTISESAEVHLWESYAVSYGFYDDVLLKNIVIDGGNYLGFYMGCGYAAKTEKNVTFENCTNNATLISLGDTTAMIKNGTSYISGFIGQTYVNQKIKLTNSEFTGIMDIMQDSDNSRKPVYYYVTRYLGNNFSEYFEDDSKNVDKLYDSSWKYIGADGQSTNIGEFDYFSDDLKNYAGTADPDSTGTSVDAYTTKNAEKADFYYYFRKDDIGEYNICDIDVGIDENSGKFKSQIVKRYNIQMKTSGDKGLSGNNIIFIGTEEKDIDDLNAEAIIVLQKNSDGHVVKCSMKVYKAYYES